MKQGAGRVMLAFCGIWLWGGAVVAAEEAPGGVRVALVGPELEGSGEAALGLAEAELSGREGVELLDRATVGRVLREQDLAAGGLIQAEDAIRLGQVLPVDVFIHVEPVPGQEALGVVGFETAEGIRLLDEVAPGPDATALAEQVESAVSRALDKWQKPAGQATAIALLSVRNVDLPISRQGECDAFGALLERRLLGSPDVVVVERKRLASVNLDREIAPDRPGGRLIAAPVWMELDVEQGGGNCRYRVAVHLAGANGLPMGIVRTEGAFFPEMAAVLASNILVLVNAQEAKAMDAELEAVRFLRKAAFWSAHGRIDQMWIAAEAAHALDPDNRIAQLQLVHALFAVAGEKAKENRLESLEQAARGMGLLRELDERDPVRRMRFLMRTQEAEQFVRQYGRTLGRFRQESAFSLEEQAAYERYFQDWLACSAFAPGRKSGPSSRDLSLLTVCDGLHQMFPGPEEAWVEVARQVGRWAAGRAAQRDEYLIPYFLPLLIEGRLTPPAGKGAASPVRSEIWDMLEDHRNPGLRWCGRCGRIEDALQADGADITRVAPEVRALQEEVQAALQGSKDAAAQRELGRLAGVIARQAERCGWKWPEAERGNVKEDAAVPAAEKEAEEVRSMPVCLESVPAEPPGGKILGHAAVLEDGTGGVYVVSVVENPDRLVLQHWMPGMVRAEVLGEAVPEGPLETLTGSYSIPALGIQEITRWVGGVVDACLNENHMAVAVHAEGVYLFPRRGGPGKALHVETPLPMKNPRAIGFMGETLFIGTDEGDLVAYDCGARSGELVVSSRRKETKTPFDNGPPAVVSGIIPDHERERIVMLISVTSVENPLEPCPSPLGGIWEYRPGDGEFHQRLSLPHESRDVAWCRKGSGRDFILYTRGYENTGVFRYDLATDALDLLTRNGAGWEGRVTRQVLDAMPASEESALDSRRTVVAPPFLALGEELWTVVPFGRLSMTTYRWEAGPALVLAGGEEATVHSALALVELGSGQMLLAEHDRLWRMRMDSEP